MNKPIARLAVFTIALLVSLVVASTYWQVWAAPALAERQDNALRLIREYTVKRGKITASDGKTVFARNRIKRVEGQTFYLRQYPTSGLAAHAVGYSTQAHFRTGLERSLNDFLVGSDTSNFESVLRRVKDDALGGTLKGSDIRLTINAKAQRVAMQALGDRCGAVVAIEPTTGRVLVLASKPTFNPNLIEGHFDRVARSHPKCGGPLLNRATSGLYSPGSTFKVVTMGAALESGDYTPESQFTDRGYCEEYGQKVSNYADQSGPEVFGRVNLVQAMEHSVNSVFCELGKEMGPLAILDQAKRFGFYALPPLDTPVNEKHASGLYKDGRLFDPTDPNAVDPGRLGFGQESHLEVTPLQMAMVAAGVANGGLLMDPQLVQKVTAPDGRVTQSLHPRELSRALSPETAEQLTRMMQAVVSSGTGTAAQLPGISVAGKTGTAETGTAGVNTAWFIAFAPADAPRVAIAVVLEKQHATGGAVSAPIAREVLQALLPTGATP